MDLRLHLLAVLLVIMALVEAGTSLSIPTSDLEDEAKESQVETVDDKRATWLETRELEDTFKDLVYNSLQKLVSQGKVSSSVLVKATSDVADKRRRWQGFCFRKTRTGRFLPYICWKGGKK